MIAKRSLSLIVIAVLIILAGSVVYAKVHNRTVTQPPDNTPNTTLEQLKEVPANTAKGATPRPDAFKLAVPFTPQAPTANWDELHNEACEEAVALMANAYFSGDTRETLPPAEVETQISNLTAWEKTNFGYYLDTTVAETATMIRGAYKLSAEVVPLNEDQIKTEIAAGHLVIIPVNGQQVGNPYYKTPGPIYHMLLVRGYTTTQLITNDGGTKHGENYRYAFKTLYDAAADWDHSTNTIDQTKKLMIIVSK